MARSLRSRLRIGRRYSGVDSGDIVLDGVGVRNRREARERSFRERLQQDLPGALERMMQRASDEMRSVPTRDEVLAKLRVKEVPELMSVDDIHGLHESLQPEAPVYRVNPELLGAIGIAGVLQGAPNIEKVAANEAVGPHFDEYRLVGADWTAWTSVLGEGAVKACFLSHDLMREYTLSCTDEGGSVFSDESQKLRARIGADAMQTASPQFATNYKPGDTFLLWHGSLAHSSRNPGVHSFERDCEGVYTIHAVAKSLGDSTPAGFTRLN